MHPLWMHLFLIMNTHIFNYKLTDNESAILNNKKNRLTDAVTHILGRRIVVCDLGSDYLLPKENELCEIFGVSRTVLREAVKKLSDKGLIRTRQKAGTFVNPKSEWNLFDENILRWMFERPFDMKFIEDLIELRLFIETAAVRFATLRANEDDISNMKAAYAALAQAKTLDEHIYADVNFHMAIYQACKNEMFLQLKNVIKVLLECSFHTQQETISKESADKGLDLHKNLLDSIVERRVDDSEIIIRYIILIAKEQLLNYLKAKGCV